MSKYQLVDENDNVLNIIEWDGVGDIDVSPNKLVLVEEVVDIELVKENNERIIDEQVAVCNVKITALEDTLSYLKSTIDDVTLLKNYKKLRALLREVDVYDENIVLPTLEDAAKSDITPKSYVLVNTAKSRDALVNGTNIVPAGASDFLTGIDSDTIIIYTSADPDDTDDDITTSTKAFIGISPDKCFYGIQRKTDGGNTNYKEFILASKHYVDEELKTLSESNSNTSQLIGVGQAWHNLTKSRRIGSEYTNVSKKPIKVAIAIDHTSSTVSILGLYINDILVGTLGSSVSGVATTVSEIVPPSATYKVNVLAGEPISFMYNWAELS